MAYAIGLIVYGVDLQHGSYARKPDPFAAVRDEIIDLDDQQMIVSSHYSGSGDPPMYFGVYEHAIDECSTIDGYDLLTKLQPFQYEEAYQQKLAELDAAVANGTVTKALADAIKAVPPRVFITWGSS